MENQNNLIKRIEDLENNKQDKTQDSGWQNLTLINGWAHYSGQNVPQYRKIGKVVYIHGCIRVLETTDTSNRNIAQLPQGFRPSGITNNLYFAQELINGSSTREIKDIQITTSGIIMAPGNTQQGQWFPLDGISFPVD